MQADEEISPLAEVGDTTKHVMLGLLPGRKARFFRIGRASLIPLTALEEGIPTVWR